MGAPTFEEFVAARSSALLRTAYLLTRDHTLAEDLLQTVLTKAFLAWGRVEGNPEPYVRRILVNTYASWWRRKWNGEHPTEEVAARPAGDREVEHLDGEDEGRGQPGQRDLLLLQLPPGVPEREAHPACGDHPHGERGRSVDEPVGRVHAGDATATGLQMRPDRNKPCRCPAG